MEPTDPDEDCTLTVRFRAEELPPVPKIAVSNPSPLALYPADPSGAIARRVTTLNITEKTYFAPAAQPAQPVQVMRAAAANAAANAWGPFGTQP